MQPGGSTGRAARIAALVITTILVVVAGAAQAAGALAHNTLLASTPANGSSVASGPSTVELTFDQPVQIGENLNSVVVVGPDNNHWEGGPAVVKGNVVSAPVRELGPAGSYRIGYRIVSADGHPVSGEVAFTLTTAGNGTPATSVPNQSAQSGGGDGGVPIWVWILGAVVLLGAGIVLALRVGGRDESVSRS